LYPHYDAYLQPSLVEPFGIAVLEAMASGLPVVVSKVGGMQFSVLDRRTGVHHAPGDSSAIARAILELRDEQKRHVWGRAGAERARATYDWNIVGEAYLRLYRRALNRDGPWKRGAALGSTP